MAHRSIHFQRQLPVSQIALGHQIELILHTDNTIKNVIVIYYNIYMVLKNFSNSSFCSNNY